MYTSDQMIIARNPDGRYPADIVVRIQAKPQLVIWRIFAVLSSGFPISSLIALIYL